ncbi:MAG: 16S rRNA (guanine(527)-N(7))-methyltransferase RsmG [Proteobacteria bacterium]|nr:16S rRNA (guanine(527)-N(7))-methyltransferase RsmG [Pseudomonadota bacterium]MBU1389189.1 16S rRNA (guanine(527)-N(7))-methyltransferase RsmG [Pseudomonadota bacterium]MBU1543413.1 16S rRNA (guanine(527)-N(7))-methyltransferase RsmG [Pseudomonadota bacterium]MBU2482892.1 16S rRNA (guanine(527)-N(7))-methyltransferase RsmG [Pseudomonadota bacterium]
MLGVRVSSDQAKMMEVHARHLLLWNSKINITAITDPLAVAEKHFMDCLAAVMLFSSGQKVMDMGSGGGFPGIVLKIMNPSLNILMVDASRKKVSFLKDVIRRLNLENIEAVHARVEDLHADQDYVSRFDAVISRAFSELSDFVNLSIPFLKPDGCLHAMKGKTSKNEITRDILEKFHIHTHPYELPFEKSERHILSLTRNLTHK